MFVLGLVAVLPDDLFLRDYHVLERYRYLIAIAGILLLLGPFITRAADQRRLPGDRRRADLLPARRAGEDLHRHLPRQLPGREARDALGRGPARRGPDDPAAEALRPAARRLGRGDADAGLHPRPGQLADVLRRLPGAPLRRHRPAVLRPVGLALFAVGAYVARLERSPTSRIASRSGWTRSRRNAPEGAGQVQQSLFAQADGGLFGQGLGESLLKLPGPVRPRLQHAVPRVRQHPARPAHRLHLRRDLAELGLFGACGVILIYALIAARGFKTAVMAPDGFSKLLADRAHRRLRAPGVRDHRRRHEGDPADRRHPAVRLASAAARWSPT